MDALAPDQIRPWLQTYQVWWLELLFLVFVAASALAVPGLVRALGMRARWWMAAVALAAAGTGAAYVVPPTTSRIFYDEQIYQHVGQNLADLRRTQMCNYGIVEYGRLQCIADEYNKEPYGYPYILSVGYRAFGTSDAVAHHVNRWLHGLMALVLSLTVVRWTGNGAAGLLAALILSVVPEQLRWAATAAAEPSAGFFALVAVLSAVHFAQARSGRALFWLLASTAWAIQQRPESVLVVGVVGLIVLTHAPSLFKERRVQLSIIPAAIVLGAYALHLAAVRNESWGAGGAPFQWAHLWQNLPVNGWFYFADHRFPAWLGFAAVTGLLAGSADLRVRLSLLLYFLPFWAIFLFFYAGSYNYGADVRYSLVSYAPIVMLGSLGITGLIDRLVAPTRRTLAFALTTAAIGWMFLWQAPHSRSVGEEAWAARADVAFAREVAASLEPDALVLTHNPNMFLLWGVNAAQMHFGTIPDFFEQAESRHGRHVYVHWGFWCNVDDEILQQMCEKTLAQSNTAIVRESRERNYRFAFYKTTGPTSDGE